MTDLANRTDIERLMGQFYAKLLADERISFIFADVARIELQQHLPHIVDFWQDLLFDTGSYHNNVMGVHLVLNRKVPLTPLHFEVWLQHFNATVGASFTGPLAERMMSRALSIATVLKIKTQQIV